MDVHQLAETLAQRMPADPPPGTRQRVEAMVSTGQATHRVAAEGHVDARGRRRERWWCDGTRLQWHELLRLTCPETECPQAQALRAQWVAFQQHLKPAGLAQASPGQRVGNPVTAAPLMQEVPVAIAGHHCVARPARFSCFTPCPNQAHPPLWIEKQGWDLFEQGRCVAGGLRSHEGVTRPLLPDLQAAAAYVWARHLEARAIMGTAAARKP